MERFWNLFVMLQDCVMSYLILHELIESEFELTPIQLTHIVWTRLGSQFLTMLEQELEKYTIELSNLSKTLTDSQAEGFTALVLLEGIFIPELIMFIFTSEYLANRDPTFTETVCLLFVEITDYLDEEERVSALTDLRFMWSLIFNDFTTLNFIQGILPKNITKQIFAKEWANHNPTLLWNRIERIPITLKLVTCAIHNNDRELVEKLMWRMHGTDNETLLEQIGEKLSWKQGSTIMSSRTCTT